MTFKLTKSEHQFSIMITLNNHSSGTVISTSKNTVSNGEPKPLKLCSCGRRQLLQTALLSVAAPSNASDYKISGYKSQLFANLRGNAKKVLEIGIGTGPNLKYYAGDGDLEVFGVDPNAKMEKYAEAAAQAAGLSSANFRFIQSAGEAIPLSDASVDAVVGTLVLCSVTDVDRTLQEVKRVLRPGGLYLFVEHVAAQDGTFLRFVQNVLDPLQQTVADGCHLTRETGKKIDEAGFSHLNLTSIFLSTTAFLNPQVYGIATK